MCIKLMTDGDKKQQLRVIRILQALGSALIQSTVAWILFFAGGFRLSGIGFTILMGGLWVGHIIFYLLIRSGFNKRFSDPSLTQAQVIWAIFSTLLNRQKAEADRGKSNFCVCFFDIDHFKRVNDSFGHHVGDVVLKRFAAQALKSTRNADLFARFGGEEFLLLATDNDIKGAATAAERIRETIAGIDFSDLSPDLCVTLSAGVAQFKANEDIRTLLTRADKALYLAKNSGRNCIKMEAKIC